MIIRYLLKGLVLPPAINLLGLLLAWAIWRRFPRLARGLAVISTLSLWLLATPQVSLWLAQSLQVYPPLTEASLSQFQAEAIVVLGGGRYRQAPEYGGRDTVATRALVRLRYGARLARASGLPVLVSGGSVFGERESEAALMARMLQEDYGLARVWQEGLSHTTRENAIYSARWLQEKGIRRIALVSHSAHLARAVPEFERQGLSVLPAPTAFASLGIPESVLYRWLPSALALAQSTMALHEWLGIAVYSWLSSASSIKSSI